MLTAYAVSCRAGLRLARITDQKIAGDMDDLAAKIGGQHPTPPEPSAMSKGTTTKKRKTAVLPGWPFCLKYLYLRSINRNCFVILNEVKDLESTLNQLDSSLTLRMTVW